MDKTHLKGKQSGLDSLVTQLQGTRTINTIDKSKKDWDKYVTQNKLEKALEQNRKDGYIAKQKFIEDAERAERENAKGSTRPPVKK